MVKEAARQCVLSMEQALESFDSHKMCGADLIPIGQ